MHTECLPPAALNVLRSLRETVRAHQFVLAGGTAVALHLGHRMSVDFDLFTETPFSTDKVFQEIQGTGRTVKTLQEERDTLTVTVDGVKVSFFHVPYPFREKRTALKRISVAGMTDIASMKILAMAQRGAKRDFVDLFFILRDLPFAKVAENMIMRFGKDRINPVVIGKALVYFSDAEADPEPVYLGRRTDWKIIKKFFLDRVQQFVLDLDRATG